MISEKDERTVAARSLLNFIAKEIQTVRICFDCYSNNNNYPNHGFTIVCTVPHLIIWAKKSASNYWPAKLLSVAGQQINVCYFGDHIHAALTAHNCLLYSELSPSRIFKPSANYDAAVKVSVLSISTEHISK